MAPSASPTFGMEAIEDVGGARAIEVAAMLSDSVVGVKHVMNPRGGKVTPITYALFGIGGVMLLLAAFAFSQGVSNATFNKHSKAAWAADGKPPHEWRPRRISLAFDWMAFGGAITGLFCMTAGLVRFRNERVSPYFRIGSDPDVDFPTSESPATSFPLVAPLGDEFVFNFVAGMEGEVTIDSDTRVLAELHKQGKVRNSTTAPGGFEMTIPPKARIKVKLGQSTFLISSVPQPRRQAAPLFASLESRALTYFVGSAIVHIGFWALLQSIPPEPGGLTLDLAGGESRLTRVQSKAQEDPMQEEEEEEATDVASGGTGTAMALDEGKMGTDKSSRQSGQYAMENKGVDPQIAKAAAVEQARNSGILGAFSA